MIPSLLQIPSAVSDSKLHSVLPNNGKGDFQFERSTGATRINRDGLIEEVGYFSSELVQNGNFSELGSELVTNGDFADNSWWQLSSSNVNISNGKGNFTAGTTEYFYKTNTLTIGKKYKVTFEITDYTTGYIGAFGGNWSVAAVGVGTYVRYINNCVDTTFGLVGNTFVGSIDNVSVKQVDPNDRWSLFNGATITNNKANIIGDGSAFGYIEQTNTFTIGKTYKITLDAVINSGGGLKVNYNLGFASTIGNITTSGSYTFTYTAVVTGSIIIGRRVGGAAYDSSVTNISVVEVQGDRPRLSYDITNGVVEDTPHLLLEPSSTNLLTFSEDFNQLSKINVTVTPNQIISPDGTLNADKLIATSGTSNKVIYQAISAGTYTASVFAKKGEFEGLFIGTGTVGAFFNLNTYAYRTHYTSPPTSYQIENYGNGWYRYSITFTESGSNNIYIGPNDNVSTTLTITGDGSKGIYIWGAMLEQQSYATSYIPTAGTTITRAAETCNNSKPSVNSTEGVLYCEIAALADDLTFRTISVSDGTTSNRSVLRYGGTSNFINVLASSGGSNVFDNNFTLSEITDFNKIAIKYKANDFALWVNGNEVKTDTSGAVPVGLSQVQFSNAVGNSNIFCGKVKGLAVYNEALNESQLMQLTGVTASSIYNNFVTRTASFTVEALNEVKKVIDNL